MNKELETELTNIRSRLFDLANQHAGDNKGNAALHLHTASNEVMKALHCLRRGNPPEPIPNYLLLRSLGI